MSSARRVAPIHPTLVASPRRISAALVEACAGFGIIPCPNAFPEPPTSALSPCVLSQMRRASLVQIAGPSGAGKTTLLSGIASRFHGVRVVPTTLSIAQRRTATFDLLGDDPGSRASSLAMGGLGEPRLWARPAGSLSAGERARLRLTMTMHNARPGDIVIADEFASLLDRACAYALCRTLRRWSSRAGVTLIVASAHEDLEAMLEPGLVIDAASGQTRAPAAHEAQAITIERGTMEDYQRIAHLHYRAGPPATVVRVLRAMRHVPAHIDASRRMLAGVLLISMPTLNAAWRTRAWPGVFDTPDKPLNARRLNTMVRSISRVVVEPRSRGLGVATALVRAYLRNPLTPGTEATASMGSVCPFFEHAGMHPYELPPDRTDTRLLDALHTLSIRPPGLLRQPIRPGSLLERELRTWGRARKLLPTGTVSTEDIQRLTPIAACRLCSRPRAYAYTKGDRGNEHRQT